MIADQRHLRPLPRSYRPTRGSMAIQQAALSYRIDPSDIIGPRRLPMFVLARNSAAYNMKVGGMSYPQIGLVLGGRHHTTIMHGVRKHCDDNNLEYPTKESQ